MLYGTPKSYKVHVTEKLKKVWAQCHEVTLFLHAIVCDLDYFGHDVHLRNQTTDMFVTLLSHPAVTNIIEVARTLSTHSASCQEKMETFRPSPRNTGSWEALLLSLSLGADS